MSEQTKNLTRRDTVQMLLMGGAALPITVPLDGLRDFLAELDSAAPAVFFNRNIPAEAHTQMGRLAEQGISSFAFTPDNGWVITSERGDRFARNIPDECYQKLLEYLGEGHRIQSIAFPPDGGNRWVIISDKAKFARNIPSECNSKIDEFVGQRRRILCVAFPPARGDRWVVVAENAFFARNIPDECFQIMMNLSQAPRPGSKPPRQIHHVAFTPGGGWVVFADDYRFARNVPDEAFQTMLDFQREKRRIDIAAFSPQEGWSIISNSKHGSPPPDPIRTFERSILRPSGDPETIWERMDSSNVPGVSVATVINNEVAWSCGYGHLERGGDPAVHPDSVFQAASISKVFAAIGVMALVRARRFELTDDIRDILTWDVPVASGVNITNPPTVARVLQHAAGFNVPTFLGYPTGAKAPTNEEVLAGSSRRSGVSVDNPAVTITANPGQWAYSGGGYQILQRLIEEEVGQSFSAWMKPNVLRAFDMNYSFFDLSVPRFQLSNNNVASGHGTSGNDIQGGPRRQYPESAAAGLYSTAIDLANMIIHMNRIVTGNGGTRAPISQSHALQMFQAMAPPGNPNQRLGFQTTGGGPGNGGFRYFHGGSNDGFKALFYGFPNRDGGAGVAVMTNGDAQDARQFRSAIADAVVAAYGW